MYRYDAPSKLCVKFIYAGSGGTENRFKTLQECVKICGAENSLIPPCKNVQANNLPIFNLIHFSANCFLSPDPGSCNDFFPEFYYDSAEGLCKEFLFGGCEGNENRFRSIFACRETCAFN